MEERKRGGKVSPNVKTLNQQMNMIHVLNFQLIEGSTLIINK